MAFPLFLLIKEYIATIPRRVHVEAALIRRSQASVTLCSRLDTKHSYLHSRSSSSSALEDVESFRTQKSWMYGSVQRFSPGGLSFFQASSRAIGAPCSIVRQHAAARPVKSIAISPTLEISSLYSLYKTRMAVTIMTLKSSSGTSRPCECIFSRPSSTAENLDVYKYIFHHEFPVE